VRVLDSGHQYLLRELDHDKSYDPAPQQRLIFVKREGEGYPGNHGSYPGTTSQEVLRALIDRGEYVSRQVPCAETQAATDLMKAALVLLELRAARRHGRHIDAPDVEAIVEAETCEKCNHVGCKGDCH
jgi:hypothetical protein